MTGGSEALWTLKNVRNAHCGFFRSEDIATLANDSHYRLYMVLVRCGSCRFLCATQDVAHLIAAVESVGDYVRDVSIPAETS